MITVQVKVPIIEQNGNPVEEDPLLQPQNIIQIKPCLSVVSHPQNKDLAILYMNEGLISVKIDDMYAALKAIGRNV